MNRKKPDGLIDETWKRTTDVSCTSTPKSEEVLYRKYILPRPI